MGTRSSSWKTRARSTVHKLSADAKIIKLDGKEGKLADLTKGQRIRVTTKEGDIKIATKVEALRKE
jgi:hypothetical protein